MSTSKRGRKKAGRRSSESRQRKVAKSAKGRPQAWSDILAFDDAVEDDFSTSSLKTARGRQPQTRSRRLSGTTTKSARTRDSVGAKSMGVDSKTETLNTCSRTGPETPETSSVSVSQATSTHKRASDKNDVSRTSSIKRKLEVSVTSLPCSSNGAKASGHSILSKRPPTHSDCLFCKTTKSANESKNATMGHGASESKSGQRKQSHLTEEADNAKGPALIEAVASKQTPSERSTSKSKSSRCTSEQKQPRNIGHSEMTRQLCGQEAEKTSTSAGKADKIENFQNGQPGSTRTPSKADSIGESSDRPTKPRKFASQNNHMGKRETRPADVDSSSAKRSSSMHEAHSSYSTMKGCSDSVKSAPESCVDRARPKSKTRTRKAKDVSLQRESQAALIQTMEKAAGSAIAEDQAEKETKTKDIDSGEKAIKEATMEQQKEADTTPKPRKRKRKISNKAAGEDEAAGTATPAKRRRVAKNRKTKKEEEERVKELEEELITLQQLRTQCLSLGLRQYFDLRVYIRRLWKLRNDIYQNMQLSPKTVNLVNGCLALVYQLFSAHSSVLMHAVRKSTLDEHFLQDAIRDLMPDSQTYAYMMDQEGRRCLGQFYQNTADDRLARIFDCTCSDADCKDEACACEHCHREVKEEDHIPEVEVDAPKMEEA